MAEEELRAASEEEDSVLDRRVIYLAAGLIVIGLALESGMVDWALDPGTANWASDPRIRRWPWEARARSGLKVGARGGCGVSVLTLGRVETLEAPGWPWTLAAWVLTPWASLQAVPHVGQGHRPRGWSSRAV